MKVYVLDFLNAAKPKASGDQMPEEGHVNIPSFPLENHDEQLQNTSVHDDAALPTPDTVWEEVFESFATPDYEPANPPRKDLSDPTPPSFPEPEPEPQTEEHVIEEESKWKPRTKKGKFPFYRQLDEMDCGPTCLKMIFRFYGKTYPLPFLRERCYIEKSGVSLLGMAHCAESVGMRTLAVRLPVSRLLEVPVPCIAHWRDNHFVVIYKVTRKHVYVADPAHGLISYTISEFEKAWASGHHGDELAGILLLMEPTPHFGEHEVPKERNRKWSFLFGYLRSYKSYLLQLFFGMLAGSFLSLLAPFVAQAVVDQGIQRQNLSFVVLMIIAQVALFLGQTALGFIERWILLHLGVRLNLALLTDFLIKLTKLPLTFFDQRTIGDVLQRMGDHQRIEAFLTTNTLSVVFSLVNVFVFGTVLAFYNVQIFLVFIATSLVSVAWLALFLKKRRELDYRAFSEQAGTQNQLVQIVSGYSELKLNNAEHQKRWAWERIQARLFRLSTNGLALEQYQTIGLMAMSQLSNIVVTYLTASAVIKGDLTLGALVAIQYIIGQVSGPLGQLVGFMHTAQDAKMAVERIAEIYDMPDEQPAEEPLLTQLPAFGDIRLDHVTFRYGGPFTEPTLDDINLVIPSGKVTAVVGTSGSGKTTLLKLLLKLYEPSDGKLYVGSVGLNTLDNRVWRRYCGTVMQDGFIFSDTIARNIALGEENVDPERLLYAAMMANILPLIETLPSGFNTKIGDDGRGLSKGQQQRLLIARVLYKNPAYLFFDEATSALDAENEAIIMQNLNRFFKGRTVVVIAHRLSTVRNADQIVVLEQGRVVELGNHEELVARGGIYFNLVRNQLELGD